MIPQEIGYRPSDILTTLSLNHPLVVENVALLVSAASQLIATVRSPPQTLTVSAYGSTLPAALGIVEELNVAEIIRSEGEKGMHVKDILARCHLKVDPKKLTRILRFLATNHWFREVSPNIFAHNLLSSLLDTGKDPLTPSFTQTKHRDSTGLAAIAGFGGDDLLKTLSYLKDTILNPQTAFSEDSHEAAFQRGMRTSLDVWAYYDSGDELASYRRRRFDAVMSGANRLQPPESIVSAFKWPSLPSGGVIVDVGGGKGHVTLEIAKAFPDLKIIIEDKKSVIEDAKLYWEKYNPTHILEGKVDFLDVDFFEPQPTHSQAPDIFLLRQIMHDWSDSNCVKLLKNLRMVAKQDTKLVIIDSVILTACESLVNGKITHGENQELPPYPLLPNMGYTSVLSYMVDLVVLSVMNGSERTLDDFDGIIKESGWKLLENRSEETLCVH
ncbi:S-adenosyl-L-methionine-dependent methyltransferase [Pyrrhoderma noxium]|uniref:S-adenosyl-L-methionine-dependent methyltransferase n=1 Tax=Pyrrhoderma noxium TaxID=2282107 RepID=A0A286UPP0_9AGAM|nr:S-adenosyl-L-methionine-dependent methyltransferase [Pyrrhoderma noxium]